MTAHVHPTVVPANSDANVSTDGGDTPATQGPAAVSHTGPHMTVVPANFGGA